MHYWLCRSMYGRTFDTLDARLSYPVLNRGYSTSRLSLCSRSSFAFRRNYTNSTITEITSSAWPMFATVLQFPRGIATHRCANWHYHPLLRINYIPVSADVARCSSVSRQNRHTAGLIRLSSRPSEGTQLSDFLSISPSAFLI